MAKTNALFKLVTDEQIEGRIAEIDTDKDNCFNEIRKAWDEGQTIDTRAVRRKYRGLHEELTQLQEELQARNETPNK